MLIHEENPQYSIYYIASKIIQEVKSTNNDYFNVFQNLNSDYEISIRLYNFCIDWLYMLNILELKNGEFNLCI